MNRREVLRALSILALSACDESKAPHKGNRYGDQDRQPPQPSATTAPAPEELEFGTDLDAGVALATRKNRRLILFFSASWNGPCKEQERVFATPAFKRAAAGFVGVLIDVSDQVEPKATKAVADYRTTGVPAVLVFDSTGKEVQRVESFEPLEKWLERLAQVK